MRRGIVGAAAGLLVLVCVLAVGVDSGPLVRTNDVTYTPPRTPTPTGPTGGAPPPPSPRTLDLGGFGVDMVRIVTALLLIGLVVAAVVLAIAVIRALRQRWLDRAKAVHLPTPQQAVTESVDQALEELSVGSPDNAIIACWVGLEQAVRAAGLEHHPSETSAELTLRVLSDLDVDDDALTRLAHLYREARFSSHPLTEGDRAAARAALEQIRTDLGRPVSHAG
ncbi:DUF4129 domain-containing protein [Calidifontibacter sp. DB0510]|uniref:DUF4129 domain-containing protein n=1 Tax=Metallococcus carri TaxID=1656884 RepID=A0A967EH41_9MICO|nr:DUF4129 domain-containing protein [Metallococcus carri]NHN55893.1 DUF4129 domain-containing protein [Metallococcus carri]NOP38419.1 DUF4129 domain-containing protein [Calidifontibacter sp. DB2511S]